MMLSTATFFSHEQYVSLGDMTPRDKAWTVCLALARDTDGFAAKNALASAREVWGEDAPSRRTIDSTLDAMVEAGFITRLGDQGDPSHYIEADREGDR